VTKIFSIFCRAKPFCSAAQSVLNTGPEKRKYFIYGLVSQNWCRGQSTCKWEKAVDGENILLCIYYCCQRVFGSSWDLIFNYLLCIQGLSSWTHYSEVIQLKGYVYKGPNKNVSNIWKEF